MTSHTNEDYVAALARDFPRLFRDGAGLNVSYPPGWDATLRRLCARIDQKLEASKHVSFRVDQIKEKFGTLRFYYSVGGLSKMTIDAFGKDGLSRLETDPGCPAAFPRHEIDALIQEAELETATICAFCARPGTRRSTAWIHVTCDSCEADLRNRASRGGAR